MLRTPTQALVSALVFSALALSCTQKPTQTVDVSQKPPGQDPQNPKPTANPGNGKMALHKAYRVFTDSCGGCHNPQKRAGGLDLVSNLPNRSIRPDLVRRALLKPDEPGQMPKGGSLPEVQKAILRAWRDEGYPDTEWVVDDSVPPSLPGGTTPSTLTLPMTRAQLETWVNSHPTAKANDLLNALPEAFAQHYVMMEKSRSRHMSDLDSPRIILYGGDTRFIISFSSHPSDPLREVAEVIALDEQSGKWDFLQVDFRSGKPKIDSDSSTCQSCHGKDLRPIWGSYPIWPGAFGGKHEGENPRTDQFTAEQVQSFLKIVDRAKSGKDDRFSKLELVSIRPDDQYPTFLLPNRGYNYTNTVFNFELGPVQAQVIHAKLKNKPWTLIGGAFAGAENQKSCSVKNKLDDLFEQHWHTLPPELRSMDDVVGSLKPDSEWNVGNTGLKDLVSFYQLMLEVQKNTSPDLKAFLEPVKKRADGNFAYGWGLRGEARVKAIGREAFLNGSLNSDDYYLDPFRGVMGPASAANPALTEKLCLDILAKAEKE